MFVGNVRIRPLANKIPLRGQPQPDSPGCPPEGLDRFDVAVRQIVGKRLTFDQLTGKTNTEAGLN